MIKYVLRHFALLLSIYRRVAIGCEICYFLKDSFNCTAMSGCQILSAINYLHLISRSRRFTGVSYSACFTCYVTFTGMGVMLRVLSRLIQHVLRYLKDFCYRAFSKQQFMPNSRILFSRDCCCLVIVCLLCSLFVFTLLELNTFHLRLLNHVNVYIFNISFCFIYFIIFKINELTPFLEEL